MSIRSLVLTGVAVVLCGGALAAQCLDISFDEYGKGCTPFFTAPHMSGAADTSLCTVSLTMTAPPTCCNVFVTQRILIIGVDPAALPFPALGVDCTLLVDPLLFLSLPPTPDTLTFHVPAGIPSGTVVYLQHAVDYFTTIGLTHDFALSNGLRVSFD